MYYKYKTKKKPIKYNNYTKRLHGGILDNTSIKKGKKFKKSLYKSKNNSKKAANIAEKSLNKFLDIASNSAKNAQTAVINTYKILAPSKIVEIDQLQQKIKNNPNYNVKKQSH